MRDELAIYFNNPATDPLGREGVEGKVLCTADSVVIRFKQQDRAFKKNDPDVLEFDYSEIGSVNFQSKFFGPKILTITTRKTDRLKEFPGAEVAKVELHVLKSYRKAASEMSNFIDYYQSEAYLEENNEKLLKARKEE